MLEQLRRNSRSFIIWILFAIIIAAFVFTFGSQGGLSFGGGGPEAGYVLEVDDEKVSVHSLRFGSNTLQASTPAVLDQLVVREILAQAADNAGARVTAEQASEHIARGKFWILGNPQDGRDLFLEKVFEGGDPDKPLWLLDFKRLEALVRGWGLSPDLFVEEQRRELMADIMRTTLVESAVASADEAKARFEHQNTTATIDAVVFRPTQYRRDLTLTEDQIETYLAEHGPEVEKKYKENERLYKDVGEQVRVRQIVVQREAPAAPTPGDEATEGAEAAAGSAEAAAKQTAEQARERIAAGADFAEVAAEVSDDERTKRKGGDLGWKSLKNPGLGFQELADALAKLEVGQVSEVIETPRGHYILKVEDQRSGDLSYDQVKHEIAERQAREHYAREMAREDAEAALAKAKAGQTLDELFERQQAPRFNPNQLPPELLQQLTPEQLQQLMQQSAGGEQGSLVYESPDIPAESLWQGAQPTGAAADQPAPAKPAAGQAGKHKQAGGAKKKPAQPAGQPAAGAGQAEAAQADPAQADAAQADPGTGGARPDRPAPKVQRIGPFPRDPGGEIDKLGESEELMNLIFDELSDGDLAPEVYEVDDKFVVVQVVERKNPKPDEYDDEEQARLIRAIATERGYNLYRAWLQQRCQALANAGKISLNVEGLLQITGNPDQLPQYRPCSTLR